MPDISFIVPYRNRETHLNVFILHITEYLKKADFTWQICIIEQEEGKPFNRAKLLNIGALEFQASWYVFHDVDMLPVEVDYSPCAYIKQLASSNIQRTDYLGGVTMFRHIALLEAGGYNNDYFHRAEDNEMRFNLKYMRLPVEEKHGTFELQDHQKAIAFDIQLWKKAQLPRITQDQLSICNYAVIKNISHKIYKHIVVSI